MDKRISVLFVCVHNSARSQMAEAFLRSMAGDHMDVESAGLEPGALNPIVVAAMRESGIDISAHRTKSVDEFLRTGRSFTYVITVCDETQAERCPVFPGRATRLHWSFDDPSSFAGTPEERLRRTCAVRDQIRAAVQNFYSTILRDNATGNIQ